MDVFGHKNEALGVGGYGGMYIGGAHRILGQ